MGVGQLTQVLVEEAKLIIVEGAGSQGELLGLLNHGAHDRGVAMALIDRGVGGQTIEILIPLHVPDPDALTAA